MPIVSQVSNKIESGWTFVCKKYPFVQRMVCPAVPLAYVADAAAPIGPDTVLVLEPADYWALRVELNAKSEAEAAKFGPSFFDVGEEYGFQARKVEERIYVIVAYNRSELARKLRENPAYAPVRRVTFSQWVFSGRDEPVRVDEKRYLTVVDGIVIEVASEYVKTDDAVTVTEALANPPAFFKTLPIEELLPEKVTSKTLKTTLAVLLIVLVNLIVQISMDYRLGDQITEEIEATLESSHLPATSIERDAVVSALKQKEEKQLRLRQQCYQLSSLPVKVAAAPVAAAAAPSPSADGVVLIPGSKPGEPNRLLIGDNTAGTNAPAVASGMEELHYDGSTIKMRFSVTDSESGDELKSEILKRFKNARVDVNERQVEVRLK